MSRVKRRPVAAVIGGGTVDEAIYESARRVGTLLARAGFDVVCGGLTGVMEAAAHGASQAGGTVLGVLPGPVTADANPYITFAIATNMGHARNAIIAHTADLLVAVDGEAGTLSEIAFGLKLGKPVFGLGTWPVAGVTALPAAEALPAALEVAGLLPGRER